MRFNLSEWALKHRCFVVYMMIVAVPVGINATLVADQPQVVQHSISEFTDSLWQAIVIIVAVSFVSLGVRAGTIVALAIPLTLAVTFPIMLFFGIDLQRISLGALIIALHSPRGRRDDHGRRDDYAAYRRR
ncbi:MAG: efflux RND transporter permease subunit [Acetobacteraceae bacterium]